MYHFEVINGNRSAKAIAMDLQKKVEVILNI